MDQFLMASGNAELQNIYKMQPYNEHVPMQVEEWPYNTTACSVL